MSEREKMLATVRRAVAEGNRAGAVAELQPRGTIGYQGAGGDPAMRFAEELKAAGGMCHRVADPSAAREAILALLKEKNARPVLLGRGRFLDSLQLEELLRSAGQEPIAVDRMPESCRETFFSAAAGISGVDYLVAETGTVVLETCADQPRSLSLLPPLHIAVAERGQLIADLFDLFDGHLQPGQLPACVSLITGPSKTGDIELRLVTGVHGPGVIHVILIDPASSR